MEPIARARRAAIHAALGDELRLAIVDALAVSDRTPGELARGLDQPTNLLAHHLRVLEDAGLITVRRSESDGRQRWLRLALDTVPGIAGGISVEGPVLFVCTHNSARSQLAAALWREQGGVSASAGLEPAERVHELAARVARGRGLDLAARPIGYDGVSIDPALVVSVCDRARAAGWPFAAPDVHWSVPDPVAVGDIAAFEAVLADLDSRVSRLANRPRQEHP